MFDILLFVLYLVWRCWRIPSNEVYDCVLIAPSRAALLRAVSTCADITTFDLASGMMNISNIGICHDDTHESTCAIGISNCLCRSNDLSKCESCLYVTHGIRTLSNRSHWYPMRLAKSFEFHTISNYQVSWPRSWSSWIYCLVAALRDVHIQ